VDYSRGESRQTIGNKWIARLRSIKEPANFAPRFGVKQCKVNSGFVAIFVFCGDFQPPDTRATNRPTWAAVSSFGPRRTTRHPASAASRYLPTRARVALRAAYGWLSRSARFSRSAAKSARHLRTGWNRNSFSNVGPASARHSNSKRLSSLLCGLASRNTLRARTFITPLTATTGRPSVTGPSAPTRAACPASLSHPSSRAARASSISCNSSIGRTPSGRT